MIDPITAEIVKSALVYAGEEMGIAVRNSAYSPNIKERLDHSCALFDRHGRLIAQAEHIPVHLGSLPWGLKRTLESIEREHGGVRQGEMWVANDPYVTGTHLNDVTVMRPIFHGATLVGLRGQQGASCRRRRVGAGLDAGRRARPLRRRRQSCRRCGWCATIASSTKRSRSSARTRERRRRARGDLRAQIAGNVHGRAACCSNSASGTVSNSSNARSRVRSTTANAACAPHFARFRHGVYDAADYLEDREGKPSIAIVAALRAERRQACGSTTPAPSPQRDDPLNAVFGRDAIRRVLRAARRHRFRRFR